jgi:hypothetical protein
MQRTNIIPLSQRIIFKGAEAASSRYDVLAEESVGFLDGYVGHSYDELKRDIDQVTEWELRTFHSLIAVPLQSSWPRSELCHPSSQQPRSRWTSPS